MDQGKAEIKSVCHGCSSLCPAGVWADYDTFLSVAIDFGVSVGFVEEVLADPFDAVWFGVEVVDWDVEEALDLRGVEVHCDNVVATSGLEHVGH